VVSAALKKFNDKAAKGSQPQSHSTAKTSQQGLTELANEWPKPPSNRKKFKVKRANPSPQRQSCRRPTSDTEDSEARMVVASAAAEDY
jgi:hypothetical protein